ncbi:sugar ABC transporter permease [Cytobacillus depressus]|uniref:Autoinducer 2 import system permease protein LsrC n=1 Tax=Cytobacillus depressus TaxID=1602942 RepID=A0A6L3V9E1_9BACI|nr:sugar ABC transporter permease [Cytobacillus depressus]KAB2334924.1 sugar ABC transporter permease [Cytobacillus depressus]
MTRLLKARELSITLLLIVFFIAVGFINHEFVTGNTISLMLKASAILLVMAVGQSFVLFTANIDVSVGAIMGLSAAVCGVLLTNGVNVWFVVLAVLMVGTITGLINGVGVSYFKIPSIIMTLGMLGIIRGVMLLYTEGMWIEDIPNYYKKLSGLSLLGVALPVWLTVSILIIAHIYLTKTKFGRYFFAVGDNEAGARLVGLPVNKVKMLAFAFSGISASIAGLIFVMNIGFVPNQTGSGIELQVIVAAVLGGVSLTGGAGSVAGAGLGAIFFTVINNSLVYLKIPAYWNDVISGLLLLVIVVGDSRFQKYLMKHSAHTPMKGDNDNDKQNKDSP